MNVEDIIAKYGTVEIEQLPEDVRVSLEAEPEFLAQYQAQRDIALMMGLKRHEQPAPETGERLIAGVRARILQGDFPAEEIIDGSSVWKRWAAGGLAAAAALTISLAYSPIGEPSDIAAPATLAEAIPTRPQMEIIHVDAFNSVATADEEISDDVLAIMEEGAFARGLSLRTETNVADDRFLLPSMRQSLAPVSFSGNEGRSLPVTDKAPY